MPMFGLSNKFLNSLARHRGGNAALEFALILQVLLTIFSGLTEVGRVLYQANALEKSLRSGALFAARADDPLDPAVQILAANLVKTGTLAGGTGYLVSGWGEGGASLTFTTVDFTVDGETVAVIRVTASVPYVPLMAGLANLVGLDSYQLQMSHEQPYLGV